MVEVRPSDVTLVAADDQVATCAEIGALAWEADGRLDLVEALLRSPAQPRERIERELERVAELVDATGAEILRPRIHEARAKLDAAARGQELREAQRLYAEMGSAHADRIAQELEE
jgi:hypothetical protein